MRENIPCGLRELFSSVGGVTLLCSFVFSHIFKVGMLHFVRQFHQVVIGEAILLLRDTSCYDGTTDDKRRIFVDAVENCELFSRPPYVTLCEDETSNDTVPEDTISELIDPSVSSQLQTESDDTSRNAFDDTADDQVLDEKYVSSL